jgi:hypothetical protein
MDPPVAHDDSVDALASADFAQMENRVIAREMEMSSSTGGVQQPRRIQELLAQERERLTRRANAIQQVTSDGSLPVRGQRQMYEYLSGRMTQRLPQAGLDASPDDSSELQVDEE